MDDHAGLHVSNEHFNTLSISDVQFVMPELGAPCCQSRLIPTRVAPISEELPSHIVVNADDPPSPIVEICDNF
jgi:hypothetical protein